MLTRFMMYPQLFVSVVIAASIGACAPVTPAAEPTAQQAQAETAPSATPAAAILADGWSSLGPGLDRRTLPAAEGHIGDLLVFRLDPANFDFDIGYDPVTPHSLQEWQATTGADIVVNGGFFDEQYRATGLVVAHGETHGTSYKGFGGMFLVTTEGPAIRWLRDEPPPDAGLVLGGFQSFPVLVAPDGRAPFRSENALRARRTVVAEDRQGRILFLIAPAAGYTLQSLGERLAASDLDLKIALNLDGGGSTGLLIRDPRYIVPAFTRLPIVILASQR
jgi:hypothetical protein